MRTNANTIQKIGASTIYEYDGVQGIKYCRYSQSYQRYTKAFQLEYKHMTQLKKLMQENDPSNQHYLSLFPEYYSCESHAGMPTISMSHIFGISLEDYLREKAMSSSLQPLLTKQQMIQLFEQLYDAACCLNQAHILYFDLNPSNIIITNEQSFRIHLIDFTGCYYTDLSGPTIYQDMDNRLDAGKIPLSLLLHASFTRLFTRLFYNGSDCYDEYFRISDSKTRHYFSDNYHHLTNLLFSNYDHAALHETAAKQETSDDPERYLTYLKSWIKHFNQYFY